MRGKRIISSVLLSAIGIAQFAFLTLSPTIAPSVAQAGWTSAMPATIDGFVSERITANDVKINELRNSWGGGKALTDPFQFSKTTTEYNPYSYYKTFVEGKDPKTLHKFDGNATLQTLSDTRNEDISKADEILKTVVWPRFIKLADGKGTNYDNGKKVAEFKADVEGLQGSITQNLIKSVAPMLGSVRAGEVWMKRDDTAGATAGDYVGMDEGKVAALRTGTFDPGSTKRIWKPADSQLATAMKEGKDLDYGDRDTYYVGPSPFYSDFKRLMDALPADPSKITTADEVKAVQAKLLANASGVDTSGGTATGENTDCGGSGISMLNPYIALTVAICVFTVISRDFLLFFLRSSMGLLITTAGIPINGSLTSDDSKLLFGSLKNTAFDGRVEKNIVDDNMGKVARAAYDRVLNMMNMLVLIVFILIALANILQIQVNAYSFKKLVPGLVLGLILANASFFVVRAMLEVAGYAASGLIAPDTVSKNEKGDDVGGPKMLLEQIEQFGLVVKPGGTFTTDSTGPNMGLVFQQMVMNLFILAAGIMILILGFQFAIRSVIFYAVMPIAPIAFIGLYFPPLGFVWKRWFALIVSWTFMPVVAFFWLWLGFMWLGAVEPKGSGPFAYVINYAFGIAMIYLAMKTPFSMAGEAKQYLSKWNEIGRTVGMRYTPYGAGTRAVKQIAANYATRDKMLDSGPIIQNNVARKLGGDSINVMQKKSELKTQQMKDKIAGIEAAVEGRAIKELVDGKEGLISKWKNSDSKFLSGLGEALDSRNGKIVRAVATGGLSLLPGAYEKVRDSDFGKNVQAGVDKHLVHTGLVDPVSYKSRDGVIKDTKEHGRRLKNEGANSLAKAYYFGPKGVERAREEFEAEANEKDAEKAKSDAKGEAAYRNLQMHIAEGSSVVDKVAAYQRSIGDPSIETVGDLIALKPHKALAGNEALKKEVLGFQLQYKGMYKAGTKHIIGEIKSAAEENGKKDVDEVKFFRTSEINDAGKILRKLDSTALDKFGGYEEIRASDISDYTARMAGLGKIAVNATNIEKRGSAKEALTSLDEILKTDEARLHPEHATFQKEVSDYLEVLKDPKLSPKGIKEASSAFRTGRLYKELNLRTVSPDRNFKSGVVGAHESAESQAQGGGMPTTEEEVR